MTTSSIPALYDPAADAMVSTDASSFGLVAVIVQRAASNSSWRPVASACCTMIDTEMCYAQIDKEALALT